MLLPPHRACNEAPGGRAAGRRLPSVCRRHPDYDETDKCDEASSSVIVLHPPTLSVPTLRFSFNLCLLSTDRIFLTSPPSPHDPNILPCLSEPAR